jgi:transposase
VSVYRNFCLLGSITKCAEEPKITCQTQLLPYARAARGNNWRGRATRRAQLGALLGDKAYDADWLRRDLWQRGVEAVIPPRAKRLNSAKYDAKKYKWRHLVENFFQRLKEFRGIAMRSCKTDSSFQAFIYLAASVLRPR